jgi:hypothetical protein
MTSILSSISGYFSKSLMLGAFLPVIIHIIVGIFFVGPLLPAGTDILKPFQALDTQWKVLAVLFITIVLSGLLYNLNILLIRVYEGYPWKEWWVGQVKAGRHQAKLAALQLRETRLVALLKLLDPDVTLDSDATVTTLPSPDASVIFQELSRLSPGLQLPNSGDGTPGASGAGSGERKRIYSKLLGEWNLVKRRLNSEYPGRASLILPTQLGNVIRSFEYYPDKEYGMDAIALWPRLVASIDKDYAVSVDDAKTSFDFMLNASFLSGLTSLAIFLAGLANPDALVARMGPTLWVIEIAIFVFFSYCFYRLSIQRAAAWGGMVKGAFDLYRNKLLSSLGYTRTPGTREEEKRLWDGISLQMLLGNSGAGPRAQDYNPPPPLPVSAHGFPADVPLEITRGFKQGWKRMEETVFVRVKNVDTEGRIALNVVLTETLLPGRDFDWGTALVGGQEAPVTGTNPYIFSLGDINAGESKELKYQVIIWKEVSPASS